MSDFVEWVESEMEKREWTRADLSRKSGIASPQITRVLNREQNPGERFFVGIAKAFGVTLETVYRHGNKLPQKSERETMEEEADQLFKQIRKMENRETALQILRVILGGESKKRQVTKNRAATDSD